MAYEVARVLHCPLDVIVVRKVGVPSHREFAMGAVAEDGVVFEDHDTVESMGVSPEQFARAMADERMELQRRVRLYRQGQPPLKLEGKIVIIVDDGIATGASARAACEVARARGAARVIVATPVSSVGALERLDRVADSVVCLVRANGPFAVGAWYEDFDQTSNEEVIDDLAKARHAQLVPAHKPTLRRAG